MGYKNIVTSTVGVVSTCKYTRQVDRPCKTMQESCKNLQCCIVHVSCKTCKRNACKVVQGCVRIMDGLATSCKIESCACATSLA